MTDYTHLVGEDPVMGAHDPRASQSELRLCIEPEGRVYIDTQTYYGGHGRSFDEVYGRVQVFPLPEVVDCNACSAPGC